LEQANRLPTRSLAILGSTGSIGTQALEVVAANPELFSVELLTANRNADLLVEQARRFRPNMVVIGEKSLYHKVHQALDPLDIKVFAGAESIAEAASLPGIDLVLTAMVGFAGLLPTIRAIEAGKHIALANKETLVVAGQIITRLAARHEVALLPVDSEHSAIFQCLVGEPSPIEKIFLTASGGPFRGKDRAFLENATKEQALRHPNWSMGAKITIDSATLMNKGLEAIEAKWLFDLRPEQIEVVVHPQSILHSAVQFADGSIKAQMGLPDMRLPIQYALGFPHRLPSAFARFDFMAYPSLTFEAPDRGNFPNLGLCFEAMSMGGNAPCVLNAANEVAVEAFLADRVGFARMSRVVEQTLGQAQHLAEPSLDDLLASDEQARAIARSLI